MRPALLQPRRGAAEQPARQRGRRGGRHQAKTRTVSSGPCITHVTPRSRRPRSPPCPLFPSRRPPNRRARP
eukprot:scaffold407_cov245-Prasinococcus_capsulatus_cf.AAC.1